MQALTCLSLIVSLNVALGSAACASTSPDQPGVWSSDQASLTVAGSTATLQILAPGGCYGSYGEIGQPIPIGTFALPGTFTQLIGAYPGKVQYAAQYSGTVVGDQMALTVTVSALQQAFGPFTLTYGVTKVWPACMYP
jgi:hypothetical protein